MRERAKTDRDIATDPKGARWKLEDAAHLRHEVAAPCRWIAVSLNLGTPLAIRVNVCRLANGERIDPLQVLEVGRTNLSGVNPGLR